MRARRAMPEHNMGALIRGIVRCHRNCRWIRDISSNGRSEAEIEGTACGPGTTHFSAVALLNRDRGARWRNGLPVCRVPKAKRNAAELQQLPHVARHHALAPPTG